MDDIRLEFLTQADSLNERFDTFARKHRRLMAEANDIALEAKVLRTAKLQWDENQPKVEDAVDEVKESVAELKAEAQRVLANVYDDVQRATAHVNADARPSEASVARGVGTIARSILGGGPMGMMGSMMGSMRPPNKEDLKAARERKE